MPPDKTKYSGLLLSENVLAPDAAHELYARSYSLIAVLSVIWEYSWKQPQRAPIEFFVRPSWPIQEMYTTRLLVNLLWFARNYLNLTTLCIFAGVFFSPPHALIVAGSGAIHVVKRMTYAAQDDSRSNGKDGLLPRCQQRNSICIVLMVLHATCSLLVCWMWGTLYVLLLICVVAIPIISHALFTPYTDEAFETYCDVLQRAGLPLPTPRSPTFAFDEKDPAFRSTTKGATPLTSHPYHSQQQQEQSAPFLRHSFTGIRTQKLTPPETSRVNKVKNDSSDSLDSLLWTDIVHREDEENGKEGDVEKTPLSGCKQQQQTQVCSTLNNLTDSGFIYFSLQEHDIDVSPITRSPSVKLPPVSPHSTNIISCDDVFDLNNSVESTVLQVDELQDNKRRVTSNKNNLNSSSGCSSDSDAIRPTLPFRKISTSSTPM